MLPVLVPVAALKLEPTAIQNVELVHVTEAKVSTVEGTEPMLQFAPPSVDTSATPIEELDVFSYPTAIQNDVERQLTPKRVLSPAGRFEAVQLFPALLV
jgi:hypothetical protein